MSRKIWRRPAPVDGVGRRGKCLLAFATFDLAYAWVMVSATPTTVHNSGVFRWFSSVAPMSAWAMLWAAVGLVCLYHAFHRFDRFGFIAAIGLKVLWGLLSFAGWLIEGVSPLYVASWPMLTWLVWTIAGWPEPESSGKDAS